VRIAPNYSGTAVYVKDASRAVGVVASLLSDTQREEFTASIREEYEQVRELHRNRRSRHKLLPIEAARANRTVIDWSDYTPPRPEQPGIHVLEDYPLERIAENLDWTPFFHAWELAGSYPKILDDEIVGEAARKVFDEAQAMLKRIIDERWLRATAVFGLFPANAVGDDIEVYTDDSRTSTLTVLHHLRQQNEKPGARPNQSLADFIAPKDTGLEDYIGAFAVTAGIGIDEHLERLHAEHDDYNAIMLKALADRLAEAFAEHLHLRIRKEFWGYAADEQLDNTALIREKYQGIRPAPGYPACPDHTEKRLLWELLDVKERAGIELTDSLAMVPTAAVSGWYMAHPASRYFGIGRINRDQVADYADRKGMSLQEAERWLAPNLGYEPED